MYTYEYERMFSQGLIRLRIEDHEAVIIQRAQDGWRYVGYIPVEQSAEGLIIELDLIFEKEV
ncbi:DUF4177 domain-containing protein [Oscillospiraceae bacterium 44-5]